MSTKLAHKNLGLLGMMIVPDPQVLTANGDNDGFGIGVAISGDWLVMGAPWGLASPWYGHAYVYHLVNGNWQVFQDLMAPTPQGQDEFGAAVAVTIDNGTPVVVVAAPSYNRSTSNRGAVFVYRYSSGSGQFVFEQEITSTRDSQYFGSRIEFGSPTFLAIHDPSQPAQVYSQLVFYAYSGGTWSQHSVLVFTNSDSNWYGGLFALDWPNRRCFANGSHSYSQSDISATFVYSGGAWTKEQDFPDDSGGDQSTSLVGTRLATGEGVWSYSNPSSVHVYDLVGGTWTLTATIPIPDSCIPRGGGFGSQVVLKPDDPDWLLIGAGDAGTPSHTNLAAGTVYIYHYEGGNWVPQDQLWAPSDHIDTQELAGGEFDSGYYGDELAVSGTWVVAGGPSGPAQSGVYEGYVWNVWQAACPPLTAQRLTLNTSEGGFGQNMAVDGDYGVVGAYYTLHGSYPNPRGTVYIYHRRWQGDTWTLQQTIDTPQTASAEDAFGESVAISGDTIAVGSPGKLSYGLGKVFVYRRSGTTWLLEATLTGSVSTAGDQFGYGLALAGDWLIAGASGYSNSVVYWFHRSGTTWTETQHAVGNAGNLRRNYGWAVALDLANSRCLIGSFYGNTDGNGWADTYVLSGGTWVLEQAGILNS